MMKETCLSKHCHICGWLDYRIGKYHHGMAIVKTYIGHMTFCFSKWYLEFWYIVRCSYKAIAIWQEVAYIITVTEAEYKSKSKPTNNMPYLTLQAVGCLLWGLLRKFIALWRHHSVSGYLCWMATIHYRDIIMSMIASQTTFFVCSQGDQRIPAQRASNAENVSFWWRHHDHHEIL